MRNSSEAVLPAKAGGDLADGRVPLAAWWMLGVLLVLNVLSNLDRFVITMLVEPIRADLALTDFQMSVVLGPAFAILYCAGMPIFGWAADRYPRRWVLCAGALLWSAATVATGMARSFEALVVARAVLGLGEAVLAPTAYSLLADGFPRRRLTTAIGIHYTASKVGAAIAFGLGGFAVAFATAIGPSLPFLAEAQPWHIVMIMVGCPGLLMAMLVFTFKEPGRAEKSEGETPTSASLKNFVRDNRKLLLLLVIGFCPAAVAQQAMISWVPTYMERQFLWSPLQYGPILGLISVIGAATVIVKGGIVDWLYGRGMKDAHVRFYTWLLFASVPVAFGMFFVKSPVFFLVLDGFMTAVPLAFFMYLSASLVVIAPNRVRARMIAIYLTLFNVFGQGLGPTMVGGLSTYVFHGEKSLSLSMIVTVGGGTALALVGLRLALGPLRLAIEAAQNREAPEGPR